MPGRKDPDGRDGPGWNLEQSLLSRMGLPGKWKLEQIWEGGNRRERPAGGAGRALSSGCGHLTVEVEGCVPRARKGTMGPQTPRT